MSWFRARKAKSPEPAKNPPSSLHGYRFFLFLAGVAVFIVLFYAEEDWRGKSAWESYKRQLENQGIALSPSAYIPRLVPDEDNFAMTPFLAPLFAFRPGTQQWLDTNAMARVTGLAPTFNAALNAMEANKRIRANSWVKGPTDLVAWNLALAQGTNRASRTQEPVPANANLTEAARGVLAGLEEARDVLEELRTASRRPYSRFNLRYDEENPAAILLPHLAGLKHVCQLLQLRASAELALGKSEEALNDLGLLLYIAQATRNEPVLISHLVRRTEVQMAFQSLVDGLAEHRWSAPQLEKLQEQLAQFNFCGELYQALEGERAVLGLPIIEGMRRSPKNYGLFSDLANAPSSGATSLDVQGIIWAAIPSGWFYFEQLNYARAFQDYLLPAFDPTNRLVFPARAEQASARISLLTSNSPSVQFLRHRILSTLLLPGLTGVFQKTAFAQAGVDTAVTACALERYRLAQGQFPNTLEALVPQFMPKVPQDVVNGQPLKYQRLAPESYRLYSVGWNATDDGGVMATAKKGGALDLNKGDWVWR